MSCRMKNRDKALRLPTIRRLRIAATASSNVRSGCSAISVNNQPACFSNGETLPPLGFAAELPSSLQRRSQLITELGLTSKSPATSCREEPPSTIAIARARRSFEYGLGIPQSFQKESGATLAHPLTFGNPPDSSPARYALVSIRESPHVVAGEALPLLAKRERT